MSGPLRRRLRRFPRIALVLALMAWLVALPAFSAAGQVHDAFGHAGESLSHHESPSVHADEPAAGDTPSAALHFLLHYAHCCASFTALPPAAPALAVLPIDRSMPRFPPGTESVQARIQHPFRPPIRA